MKIIYWFVFSFLFTFSLFSLEDTRENSYELDADLSDDFYCKALINPSILESHSIILFTNARDEKNIREWAAHHLLLGFNLVYIFDHKSVYPLTEEFKDFDTRVIVERCEWENPVKMPLMMRAAGIARQLNASWMLYLDADEFLILNNFKDVRSFLNTYPHADSLGVNWLFFGSNYHTKEPEGLILENYTASDLILNQHVKTFVRPSEISGEAYNPHFFCIKNPSKMFSTNNKQISGCPCFNEWNIEYFNSPAYFAHYVYQSEETYLKRKVDLPRDDNGDFRGKIPNIHLYYNEIENLDPKEKYAFRVKMFLKAYEPR